MKMRGLLIILSMIVLNAVAQNKDTANVRITNYRLMPGTYSWRNSNTYFDRTPTWETSPYIDGHLRHYNGSFQQNFRLLYPEGYDENYSPGYPMMVVLHGGAERGNCWQKDSGLECYYGDTSYNPNTNPLDATQEQIDNLLNNDHNLLHGGNQHLSARNRAGTKKPNDPTLHQRAFPGFVLFPQMLNNWTTTEVRHTIRIIRLLCKKLNIDEDRIYINGISMGGRATLMSLVEADWVFAAAATFSAITSHDSFRNEADSAITIPIWMFQGGQDVFPTPGATETTITTFTNAGGNARYTLYPNLGHGTWNTAYAEPDFFSWFLGKRKTDIHAYYNSPYVCATNGAGAKLSLPQGFLAYEWQKDGVVIPGANSHLYIATEPGVYRARFSRLSANPSGGEWNAWSKPVTVEEQSPAAPVVTQIGSIVLKDLNGSNTARLSGPEGFNNYHWYKDGVLSTLPNTRTVTISAGDCTGPCTNAGSYTLVTTMIDGCPSNPSLPKRVFFNNQAPVNIPLPTNFTATLASPTEVILRWNDASGFERNYEIWRRRSTDPEVNGWKLVTITAEDAIVYNDKPLEPNTTYWYKIRAVSNEGRSDYAPGNSKSDPAQNVIISTGSDTSPPTPPQNLTAVLKDTDIASRLNSIQLAWGASTDNTGLKEYQIKYGSTTISVPATQTTYLVDSLPLNNEFNFSVYAIDLSNNVSPPSSQANAKTYIDGFFWEHSTGAYNDIRDVPNTMWERPEYKGRSANLTLDPRTQEEFFLFRFYGYISITTPGEYRFRVRSNDGIQLWIDGNLVARRHGLVTDGTCATTNLVTELPSLNLTSGPHTVELRYFQYTGDKCLSWQWQGPDAGSDPARFYDMPDTRVRSYEGYTPPTPPEVPQQLAAVAAGMTQINLTWTYPGEPLPEFEVQRSTSASGPFAIITRVPGLNHADTALTPGTTYYYRLRSVSADGMSEFTNVVSATTETDMEAPSIPTSLVLYAKTITTASIGWTASTDNTGVAGYEIWANDVMVGTTPQNFFLLESLEPFTDYSVYVVAFDANQNRSQASDAIAFNTTEPLTYFSKATGNLNELSTWGTSADGSGDPPSTFSINGLFLTVANRTETQVGGSWTVDGSASRVIVPSGITLTVAQPLNANVEVHDNGYLILANATTPTLVDLSPGSSVQYNQSASTVRRATYGNLVLQGTGTKTFQTGATTVLGNMSVSNGLVVAGAGGNQSRIILSGNLVMEGARASVNAATAVGIEFAGTGTQTVDASSDIEWFSMRTAEQTNVILTATAPINIRLGSPNGGGVILASGSSFALNDHTLNLIGASTINPGNESGRLLLNNATINIASSSANNSNIYADTAENNLSRLTINLTGSGDVIMRSLVNVTDGVKITSGDLDANGNITLISTEPKTANLEEIENDGRVLGNMNVQRYISDKAKTYRYLSASVEGVTIEDLQEYFPVTGKFQGASVDAEMRSAPSIYYYVEPNWVPYPTTTNQAVLQKGVGYSIYIKPAEAMTLETKGIPHQGDVSYGITPPSPTVAGWNLIGNPYASTIQWSNNAEAWIKSNIGSVVAVRNNFNSTSGQFLYYDASTGLGTGNGILTDGLIAPGQAYYVQSTGANPTLTITESAKATDQQTLFRESASNVSHFKISLRSATFEDESLVILSDYATDVFEPNLDGMKQNNIGLFSFSTTSEDLVPLAINNLSESFCGKQIALNMFDVSPGTYAIAATSLTSLVGVGEITLTDRYNGMTTDLSDGKEYTFEVSDDPASAAANRFTLSLNRPQLQLMTDIATNAGCSEDGKISLNNSQQGVVYSIRNTSGVELATAEGNGGEVIIEIPKDNLVSGTNQFVMSASFKGCTADKMETHVQLNYLPAPVVTANDVMVCSGATATLKAESSLPSVSYKWYDEEGRIIKGESLAQLTTAPITTATHYFVSAETADGCEGAKSIIIVSSQDLATPSISLSGDTLYANVEAEKYQWSLDGTVVEETASAVFVPMRNGSYIVTAFTGECVKASAQYVVFTETLAAKDRLGVYPNPTNRDNIYVRGAIESNDQLELRILDVMGKEVHRISASAQAIYQGLKLEPGSPLKAGVYFLLLEDNSKKRQVRFIITD